MRKWCTGCSTEKPLSEFPNDRSKKDGKSTRCILCRREANRRYRKTPEGQAYEYWLAQQDNRCAICGE